MKSEINKVKNGGPIGICTLKYMPVKLCWLFVLVLSPMSFMNLPVFQLGNIPKCKSVFTK